MTTEPALPRALQSRDAERLHRYREYIDYYEGRRGAPPALLRERVLTFNYARAMVEKGASYLVTAHRPVVTPVEDSAVGRRRAALAERALLEVWQDNDLARLDFETEVDTAVLGDGAFKVTWDEREQRVVVSAPDVQGIFAWWAGDDVRRLERVASRYRLSAEQAAERLGHTVPGSLRRAQDARPGRDLSTSAGRAGGTRTVEVVESWTAEQFELWVANERVETRANPYGEIPFVIYPNLPRPKQFWGISDIEPLREPIAELNRALTQLSRILELSGNPIAVLENVEQARDIAVQPGAVWEIPEQARAYLLDLLQGGGVRLHVDYVDLVYRTLHDLGETPRVAFGDAGGVRSGIALQTELDPLLRKVARKRLIRDAALRRRDRLILRVLGHHTNRALLEGLRTEVEWDPVFTTQPAFTASVLEAASA
jgi:hypothetical protein